MTKSSGSSANKFGVMRPVRRRQVLSGIGMAGAAAALHPLAAFAQGATRRPVVGFYHGATRDSVLDLVGAFLQGMKDLGYTEGQNVTIEWRFADGNADRMPALAQELVRLGPDIIVSNSGLSLAPLRAATTTIPTVFVNSAANPAPNEIDIVGAPIALDDHFRIAKEVIPGAGRVGMLDFVSPAGATVNRQAQEAAASPLGLKVSYAEYTTIGDVDGALQALGRERVDAVVNLGGNAPLIAEPQKVVAAVAAVRLPAVYNRGGFVSVGGLIAYYADQRPMYRVAAGLVDQFLKGAKAADLKAKQPQMTGLYLSVNLTTAKTLGLTLPASLLSRADEKIG